MEVPANMDTLKSTIDIHDTGKVIAFGREEQASIGKFADIILHGAGKNETEEASQLLTQAITAVNGYQLEEEKKSGFFRFLKKEKKPDPVSLQEKYHSLSYDIDAIVRELQKKDFVLIEMQHSLEMMYEQNLNMYRYLTAVVSVGEQILEEEKQKLESAKLSQQNPEDFLERQHILDQEEDLRRFERRLYDLKLSRTVAMQQAPQIKVVQKGIEQVSEGIRSAISTAIPLWKSQMVIALGSQSVQEGLGAVSSVRDATNRMLLQNSENAKRLAIESAREAQRGTVDIKAVSQANKNLIDALNSTFDIARFAISNREEGRARLEETETMLKLEAPQQTVPTLNLTQ